MFIDSYFESFLFVRKCCLQALKFENDPNKLIDLSNELFQKGKQFNIVTRSFNILFIGIHIDFFISKFKSNKVFYLNEYNHSWLYNLLKRYLDIA